MPVLHKNITAAADIHNPKWFSGANNGDYSWKNELGELETTDELLLPSALNFVDASVAPPTTNAGDIYVLASGGSVDAGWGAVSLDDWVRYDGSAWNSITPQKSSLCYDKTADVLMSFDGTDWQKVGSSIYKTDDTIGSGRVATLTDTLKFKGGTTSIEGADTLSTSTAFEIYDGDTTPNKLWDFRNNGYVEIGQFTTLKSSKNASGSDTIFEINADNNRSAILVVSDTGGYNGIQIASYGSTASGAVANKLGMIGGLNVGELVLMNRGTSFNAEVWLSIGEGAATDWVNTNTTAKYDHDAFYVNNGKSFIVGSGATPAVLGSEIISLQGDTLVGATADKVGFMGTAPIVQVTTGVAAATFTANTSGIADDTATFDGYTIGQVVKALRNYGLLA